MYYIVYTSYAVDPFQEETLKHLLLCSRENNGLSGITGMLYYFQTTFYQLIEGEENKVKRLYQKIIKDPRHHHAIIIKEGQINQRFFPEWTMGYKFLNAKDFRDVNIDAILGEPGIIDPTSVLRLFQI